MNVHNDQNDRTLSKTVRIAEDILSGAFGEKIRLGNSVDLSNTSRSKVYCFEVLDGSDDVPTKVIVKQAIG